MSPTRFAAFMVIAILCACAAAHPAGQLAHKNALLALDAIQGGLHAASAVDHDRMPQRSDLAGATDGDAHDEIEVEERFVAAAAAGGVKLPPLAAEAHARSFGALAQALPSQCTTTAGLKTRQEINTACGALFRTLNATDSWGRLTTLKTICATACGAKLQATWDSYGKPCFRGAQMALLGSVAVTCAYRPHCYGDSYTSALTSAFTACSTNTNFNNFFSLKTTATESEAFCTSTCATGLTTFTTTWGVCMSPDVRLITLMASTLCVTDAGVRCATTLKTLDKYECTALSPANCALSNVSCYWDAAKHKCETDFTPTLLASTCTTCLTKFVGVIGYVNPKAGRAMAHNVNWVCLKDNSTYCLPTAMPIWKTHNLFDMSNMTVFGARAAVQGAVCATSTTRRCTRRVFVMAANMQKRVLINGFRQCVRARSGSTASAIRTACGYYLTAILKQAKDTAAAVSLFRFFCMQNTAGYCFNPVATVVNRSDCFSGIVSSAACPSSTGSCALYVGNVTSLGCCAQGLSQALRFRAVVPRLGLVQTSGGLVDFTPKKPLRQNRTDWASTYWQYLQNCSTLNTAEFKANMTAVCPGYSRTGSPVAKSLSLTIQWAAVSSNRGLRLKLQSALDSDIAAATGLPTAFVGNGRLEQGTSSSRRSTSTVVYKCDMDGPDDSEASDASTSYDAQVTAKSLLLTSTADAVTDSDCEGCVLRADGSLGTGTQDLFGTSDTVTYAPGTTASPTSGPTTATTAAPSGTAGLAATSCTALVLFAAVFF
jgi:hypothetical protein